MGFEVVQKEIREMVLNEIFRHTDGFMKSESCDVNNEEERSYFIEVTREKINKHLKIEESKITLFRFSIEIKQEVFSRYFSIYCDMDFIKEKLYDTSLLQEAIHLFVAFYLLNSMCYHRYW